MLLLTSTSDLIQVITGSAADVEVHASWMEADNSVPPVVQDIGRTNTASITTPTATTVVPSPAANRKRNVKHLNIYNNHASQDCLVTVQHTDGTNVETLAEVTLLASETLVFTQGGVWVHYDANGGVYPQVGAIASQNEMEAATSLVTTVSPGRMHFHPGIAKVWGKANGAGTSLIVNYNVSSISDTGTGRLGVNIGTDFSSSDYSIVCTLQRSVTSLTATGVEDNNIRNNSQAAGSFEIESYDHTAILFAAQDPQAYFWACYGDQP